MRVKRLQVYAGKFSKAFQTLSCFSTVAQIFHRFGGAKKERTRRTASFRGGSEAAPLTQVVHLVQ
jgi:hypothetical protein